MKCIENLINETKREGGTKNFIVEKKPFDDLTIEIKKKCENTMDCPNIRKIIENTKKPQRNIGDLI